MIFCNYFECFLLHFWFDRGIIEAGGFGMENQKIFYELNRYIYNLSNFDIDSIEIYNNFLYDNNLVIANPELSMIILRQIEALVSMDKQLLFELL